MILLYCLEKKRTNTLAGYSTKLAESLSLGTPVICNKIGGSDIDITDGKNGFKINKYSMKYLKDILRKISKMDVKEINDLKNKSYIFAKSRYNINDHSNDFEIMLSKAKTTVK